MSLADNVKEWAQEAGFDLVGITRAEPLPEAEEATREWHAAGMAAGMKWITEDRIELSTDPSRLLPGARSLISLGKYYLPPQDVDGEDAGPRGRIARYAQGHDYHDVFSPRLARFVDRLGQELGYRPATRRFVDSSPLAEKPVAVRSGVAWYGKNGCMLTNGRFGSWILLAEVLTDLDLDLDAPLHKDCGRCRICIDRCPTGAIVAPYRVDARLCISYLTIEHKGAIPRELRPKMGNSVFGCDVCQEVCPWNRLTQPMDDPAFMPRVGVGPNPPLLKMLELDAAGFKELFRGSPVLRPKRRGFLRNVAVALGNARDPVAVPGLARALEDEEPLVRSHSAWALGQIGDGAARPVLESALRREDDPEVREEVRAALELL